MDSLAELFAIAKGNIRCVVLNACHSEAQAKAIAAHIDCAIGMSGSIEDSSAIGFSWAFYHALGQGESVQKAFSLARVQAQLASPDGSDGGPEIFSTHTDLEALRF